MIKQKSDKKVTALGKRRVNLYLLNQRVEALEKGRLLQERINRNQHTLRQLDVMTTEEILQRVSELERIVLPDHDLKKTSLLARFWKWMTR